MKFKMQALNEPVGWWGWRPDDPGALSLVQLIQAGNLSAEAAAILWLALGRGGSIAVVAHPQSAGKTVTLTALLALVPPGTQAYFTSGEEETFDLLPHDGTRPTYLLVNEMSDHLPVYTWGDAARRVFELLEQGYSLGTTIHADSAEEVFSLLRSQLGVPAAQLARLTLVLSLSVKRSGGSFIRRVREIAFTEPDATHGLAIHRLANWQPEDDGFRLFSQPASKAAFAAWAGLNAGELEEDIRQREHYLQELVDSDATDFTTVNEAIARYYATPPRRPA